LGARPRNLTGTANAVVHDMTGATHERSVMTAQRRSNAPNVQGLVSPGFEPVREAFAENFARRNEAGAACCIYYRGDKVVDIWGGVRNKQTGEPWERDTMVIVYSATKGLAAMAIALAHSRGWIDYDARVCEYWPEFAQQGKEEVTVRQLLSHQAGLHILDEPLDRGLVADFDRLAIVLARQKPAWTPGTRQAYHAITLGFYEGELLRRIDRRHRSLGQFFQDEIASPLGLDVYIRLPESIANSQLATLARPTLVEMLHGFGPRFMLAAMNPHSAINRALRGSALPHDEARIYARNLEVPSGGGVGTARAIAHAYSVFANGGKELALRQATLDRLAAPAIPPTRGFHDECMKSDNIQFSLGFMKSTSQWPFGSASSFGAPGSGGALGFADPTTGIGYAYVTSQMGTRLTGDPRDVALRDALYAILRPW
jgi:CubicO group peptidase (beta-lactamase class C family)